MRLIYRIAKAELSVIFYSPVAWLILIVFAVQCGMSYCDAIWNPVKFHALGRDWRELTQAVYTGRVFPAMLKYLYFYIPLLTMSLMSREFSSGSVKLLYSSPITNRQIIFGKFLSMMIYCAVLVSVIGLYVIVGAFTIEHLDWPLLFSNFLGVYLLVCSYAAIGLFMSTLTSYQVVAAIGTLALLSVLNFVGEVGQDISFVREVTYWLALKGRAGGFVGGLINSESVIYFFVVIVSFLILSVWRLQALRETQAKKQIILKYLALIAVVILVSYFSSRPVLTFYWDMTATQKNSIGKVSQQLLHRLEGDLKITTYVNLLDPYYDNGLPAAYKAEFERFRPYIRFKPEIELKYVYYYDRAENKYLDEKYSGLSDWERAEKICKGQKLDLELFLTPEEIRQQIDLSGENNRFVRLVEWQGKKEWLRIYDDMYRFPSEQEVDAVFKRLLEKSVKVAFLTGHGERGISSVGETAYSDFAGLKTSRNALINQGFDVMELPAETGEIPEEVDILVIADLKKALTETELEHIRNYVSRGGNLFVLGEPGRQEYMNPVVELAGVRFMDGTLVQQSEDFAPSLITANLTAEAAGKFSDYAYPWKYHFNLVMPGCVGLDFEDKGFEVCVVARSQDSCSWNETGKNVSACSWPVLAALSRKAGDQEQRILVSGDADCISNVELSRGRNGIRSANPSIVTASFRWLAEGKYPVEIVRAEAVDNKIRISRKAMPWIKVTSIGVFPCLLLIAYGIIRNRRKRK